MPRALRSIPFGPQFSPEQTPLPRLLALVKRNSGNYDGLNKAIQYEFFPGGGATAYNRRKKADNTTLALRDYGILEEDKATPTALGRELIGLIRDEQELYERFARHILLNCNGLAFVRAIQDELHSRREISLTTLPRVLARRGLTVPKTGTHISALKGWLRMAGVFTGGRSSYDVETDRLTELLGGVTAEALDALSDLDALQRAFLKALARFPIDTWHPSNKVAEVAEAAYGVAFPWKSIKATVLDACADAGLIEFKKTTAGRGAKPYLVIATGQFKADVVTPLLEAQPDQLGARLREYLRTPLPEIVANLASPVKNTKGKALELLAVALIFTLDLDFVAWRKRGSATAGAEVDVLAESARLVFSRWQLQCKNGNASLEDVAKEVGLAYHLNSNVIVVLTTRRFSGDTRRFADSIMRKSNLQIVLLDGRDLQKITNEPTAVIDILIQRSHDAMAVKKLQDQPHDVDSAQVTAAKSLSEVPDGTEG